MKVMHFAICTITALALLGCTRTDEARNSGAQGGGSITLWTDKSELFMEYPPLIVGEEKRFAVHLTWLSDFKPVREGTLSLLFTSAGRSTVTATAKEPTSPGIFRPTVTFGQPGIYRLMMIIDGGSTDTLYVEGLRVFSALEEIPSEEASQGEQVITFLKEQQWNTDFRTQAAEVMRLTGTIRAACEIVPKLNNEAIVPAPFTGTIPSEENRNLPTIGQYVRRDDPLALMLPSAETPGGVENFASRFIEAQSDRDLTAKEFERAKKLYAAGLISEKEYQEADAEFKGAEATYQTLRKFAGSNDESQSFGGFTLRTPLSGTIVEMNVVPGKQVNAGEPLFRIIDTGSLWMRANVASTEIGRLSRPRQAWIQFAGGIEQFEVSEENGKLVTVGAAIDPETRTFPVIFEIRNPDGRLRVGMFGEVSIAVGDEKRALVVSESALVEEEGRYSVYVQVEGEAFVKRDVTLGERNGTDVGILSGLAEGERVVTVGAYQVRLASLSSQLPAHGHEH
ncbi:MAG: efflux RND transporter periplasmic adaptor subunit [Ignavibacteria bacterium]|nr:efflux RND transporter periplasmic adaptor subunit [Ignavibacteria bacterium]